ncbi:TPA: hypothetical protein ACH3X1_000406 [Trebouxia sp. C0004]
MQLGAAGPSLSAGELARTSHSPQPVGAVSKQQLLQQKISSTSAERSTRAHVDRKLNSSKRAPDAQQQQQQQEGIPGSSNRGFKSRVKEACKAAGISFARGMKNIAAWLVSCPGRAANLIRNLAAAILSPSRPRG